YVKNDTLDLSYKGITDVSEIVGLKNLTNLKELDLSYNEISEINGLGYLTNLQKLSLSGNPIKEDERHLLKKNAQEVVKYCHKKAKKN
ncbi:MAG: leucine-rich repeat domain-containing protein, partial [Promethearchaeota archaeon]